MTDAGEMSKLLEKEKSRFAGSELRGKTLGIVGLGAIGSLVATAALSMGMDVVGFPQGTILRGAKVMWDGAISGPARGRPIEFSEAIPPQ